MDLKAWMTIFKVNRVLRRGSNRIDLSDTGLASIPPTVLDLTRLKNLNISNNQLSSLPHSIGKLTELTFLDLIKNKIEMLPDSIGNLEMLSVLLLAQNQLRDLPQSIGNLAELNSLDLRENSISSLTPSICRLSSLEYLNLSYNKLSRLPVDIGQLKELSTLDLTANRLAALPDSIGELGSLRYLDLSGNDLEFLPDSIGNLRNLRTLKLSRNRLKLLPDSILQLENLRELVLTNNELIKLPRCPPNMASTEHSLRSLSLNNNELSNLPESLGALSQVEYLNIAHNNIKILPKAIGELWHLKTLDAGGNKLQDFPQEIKDLRFLGRLDVSDNGLAVLPGILTELVQLTSLDLRNNRLSVLPDSITNLRRLQQYEELRGNKLKDPPQAIANWGYQPVFAYKGSSSAQLPLIQRILIQFFNAPTLEPKFSLSATIQTLAASLIGIYLLLEWEYIPLWISVIAAPIILTRTRTSQQRGLEVYGKISKAISVKSDHQNALVLFIKLLGLGFACLFLKVVITMQGWFTNPLEVLRQMPRNFNFYFSRCSIMDIPQLLPGLELQYAEDSKNTLSLYDLGYDFSSEDLWGESEFRHFFAILGIGIFFLISVLFRLSVKMSALFYGLPVFLFLQMRQSLYSEKGSVDVKREEPAGKDDNGLSVTLLAIITLLYFAPSFVDSKNLTESIVSYIKIDDLQEKITAAQFSVWKDMLLHWFLSVPIIFAWLYRISSLLTKLNKNENFTTVFELARTFFDQISFMLFGVYASIVAINALAYLWPILTQLMNTYLKGIGI